MRTRYHWTQSLVSNVIFLQTYYHERLFKGVLVCVGGLGMLVSSDMLTDKNYPALSKGKGDAFMIVGATLYGFSKLRSLSSDMSLITVRSQPTQRRSFLLERDPSTR